MFKTSEIVGSVRIKLSLNFPHSGGEVCFNSVLLTASCVIVFTAAEFNYQFIVCSTNIWEKGREGREGDFVVIVT